MSDPIKILHISDFHARLGDEMYLEKRASALLQDIGQLNVKIDLVLFTGDVAFSGQPSEFALADRLLIQPIKKRIRNVHKPVPVLIIPGNHDVDRTKIDDIYEAGLRTTLVNSETALKALEDTSGRKRLKAYYDYADSIGLTTETYYVQNFTISGVKIGIAALNSAWRCSGDTDEKQLFLTEHQIYNAARSLVDADIRIALVHHPTKWLHPSEDDATIFDLKRNFDLILTGHLHAQDSRGELTPASDCLLLSAPALCDGHLPIAGYNIYSIAYEGKTVQADYRQFIPERAEFDKDVRFAKDGTKTFRLPINDLQKYSEGILCQRLTSAGDHLANKLKESLSVHQRRENPIYVTPPLCVVTWQDGQKQTTYLRSEYASITSSHSIVQGAPETGKTELLRASGATINLRSSQNREGHLAVYLDTEDKKVFDIEKKAAKAIEENINSLSGDLKLSKVTILLDSVNHHLDYTLQKLIEVTKSHPNWVFVIATNNEVQYDTFALSLDRANWAFYQLATWGPSRIREFINYYFGDETVDVNAAFSFVTNSLQDSDLPTIPMFVVLYLNVFRIVGNRFSSLSFLDLLIKVEFIRFEESLRGSDTAVYNKERILAIIAAECLKQKTDLLLLDEVKNIISDYFTEKGLPYDMEALITSLGASGLVEVTVEFFQFRYYVFLDYYLARAFQTNLLDINKATSSLDESLRIANSLALYGGLFRENLTLATKLLSQIESSFNGRKNFTLNELDQLIIGELLPANANESAEEAANSVPENIVDYDKMDEDFHKQRAVSSRQRREAIARRKNAVDTSLIDLPLSLKAFYNIFRNLENIKLEDKVMLLNRILDFHIQFNMELLDYFLEKLEHPDISTLLSYMVTLAGQMFMSNNIANQNLKEAIDKAIDVCDTDFKKLLLLFLYADLRLPGYDTKLEEFCKQTTSSAAVEMIYFKLHIIIADYGKIKHPQSLRKAFKIAFERKLENFPKKLTPARVDLAYSKVLHLAEKENIKQQADKSKS